MNWLAHVFLSDSDINHRIGNLVTDLVKARPWGGISEAALKGIGTHKLIDSYTDSHPVVKRSMERLGERGKLRSVTIDILFDHMLTKNWDKFSDTTLKEFLSDFYQNLKNEIPKHPMQIQEFLESIVTSNRLGLYAELSGVSSALERIDSRLSERVLKIENSSQYFDAVVENYSDLELDFLEFFPQLANEVRCSIEA